MASISTNVSLMISLPESNDDDVNERLRGRALLGRRGRPLRLYSKDGKPTTDEDGVPLHNITGKLLMNFNVETYELEDLGGYPLRDSWGFVPSDPYFNPEKTLSNIESSLGPVVDESSNPRIIFDLSGNPLTDTKGRVLVNASGEQLLLFDSKGEALCDLENHQIINCSSLEYQFNTDQCLCDSSDQSYLLFDAFKRPLTTSDGVSFCNIMGMPLVITDSRGNPIKTIYGSDLYDSTGRKQSDKLYDPTKRSYRWKLLPMCQDEDGKPVLLFDQTGFPLTDTSGVPLIDSDGNALFRYDKNNCLVSSRDLEVIRILAHDYNPDNIRCICNDVGKPARLFNFQGKPLTNWLGEPLKHADGTIMLKFNFDCSLISDYQTFPIYDEYGVCIVENNFNPYDKYPLDDGLPRLIDGAKNGIKLYDGAGTPVTDHRGFYLTNASRKFMVQRNTNDIPICDSRGGILYTENGLPLIKSIEERILGPKGKVCRLFNKNGFPLSCTKGVPLKLITGENVIKIDKIGRIVGDCNGGMIYDCNGFPMSFPIKFEPSKSPKKKRKYNIKDCEFLKKKPLLYNLNGFPLTDTEGELLTDCHGESLIKVDSEKGCITDSLGHPVYESEGGLYEMSEYKLTPLNYIICDRTDVHYNNSLSDRKYKDPSEINFMKYQKRNTQMILFDGNYQLFDYECFPVLDRSGAVLETADGESVIKFNDKGQLICDYRGYDLYDSNGVPLTNVSGYWRDRKGNPLRLFNSSSIPLTDSRGKCLLDINGRPMIIRDEIGRPLLDIDHQSLYDCSGTPSYDDKFCPRKQPQVFTISNAILDLNEIPLRLYNSKGWPLNDETGTPLVSNKSKQLIVIKSGIESIEDFTGNTVFDKNKIPLGCKQDKPIQTMSGKPFRIFNANGLPVTDFFGTPLKFASKLCLIVFDMFGRPLQDSEGEGLYDANGNLIGSPHFRPELAPSCPRKRIEMSDGNPLRLYDHFGRPLNDVSGIFLTACTGELLTFIESGVPICTMDGGRIYDEFGNEFIPDKDFVIPSHK